jgi:hypothetical protein
LPIIFFFFFFFQNFNLLKNPIFRTPFSMKVDRDTIVAHYVCYNVEMFSNTTKRSDAHKHRTPMHVTARRNAAQVILHREHSRLNSANQRVPRYGHRW